MSDHVKIHESKYGDSPFNFHVAKHKDELHVELTYPPRADEDNSHGQCRYVIVDQEAVRASDGVRLHYDYNRDGFVIEQPKHRPVKLKDNSYDMVTDWIEVGFFKSWKFNESDDGLPTAEDFARADREFDEAAKA